MPEQIDLKEDRLVNLIAGVIAKANEMGLVRDDHHVLDALAYVYATMQRINDPRHPHKLN